ncbi:alpha,alpha-trehalase [Trichinella nativa]|uniref:Trehalase n=1 Tax=Trichinella nativa TaxID=6335 RepID=A0A1Y3EWG9_9BILA|nr:alpha,alpha-trehalase [Trichinella nativa]
MVFKFHLCQSWRIYITSIFLCSILITVNSRIENEPLIYTKEKILKQCHIFCHGELLDAVQKSHLFQDSKHFVDMSLQYNWRDTLRAFDKIANKSDKKEIENFVSKYFNEPGTDLEICTPPKWKNSPDSFKKIKDPFLQFWAYKIHRKWFRLCRKVKEIVKAYPDRHSIIYVPNPFIIPGGRFLEFYYWDSYWIIKGLLASEMFEAAKQMIENMVSLIERFGFIPNGARVYYLNRSQPPMLVSSVADYYDATKDKAFLLKVLPSLEKEYQFWLKRRSFIHNDKHLHQYYVNISYPRPEAYREDLKLCSSELDERFKAKVWSNVASACESGWDFSSRWFEKDQSKNLGLKNMRTMQIVPVDLNAFICGNNRLLAKLYAAVGNFDMATKYEQRFTRAKAIMNEIFWDPIEKMWFDYDLETSSKITNYYSSNMVPLYMGLSLNKTGEQWDYPNGWAPHIHMLVESLRQSDSSVIQEIAFEIAQKWVHMIFNDYYHRNSSIFEKYNVVNPNILSTGGEYEVQEGTENILVYLFQNT